MAGLAREVVRWLQSLDLTWQVKTPKWDLSNGYLIAEIFSWYYPQEITMHSFNNGTSLDMKLLNWHVLKNFFKRHKFAIPEEYVEGTIHCKEGAAKLLIESIYEILTNRQVRRLPSEYEIDFTDRQYQEKLPMHARSTASQAVKNNLRITELMADNSFILGQQKAQEIIGSHVEHRRQERLEDPRRFGIKPTLGERSPRRPPPPLHGNTEFSELERGIMHSKKHSAASKGSNVSASPSRVPTVQFKEVEVKQLGRPTPQFRPALSAQ
ncbi:spermatogenesis-associated protein 4-like [Lingula anatina]|uniref:Spermatogenesis-associated protein 4 n=1 Tax=Lingula anatina TaxID=7574 RepID=A0A1S3HMP1_LINAN|nr:spermatogenesis-associated protein 4 isoform X1 [Lingula anatina]XP_013386773.1 spermatogenesis-associated protein 4 isoform X2 [Lingula anatina]XP_013400956.1 spermatogenesis-associated protein 4-like [Lingula anatina]|eukprot:XP_013386771.1 spermatogenesis-associated protein 4 isoform X1 [Lingula anatina]